MSNSFPYDSSGDNVYKFIVIICIGLLVLNFTYPRQMSLELAEKESELVLKKDILLLNLEPAKAKEDILWEKRKNLDSLKNITGNYPSEEKKVYDSLYKEFSSNVNEVNELKAEFDHHERVIKKLKSIQKYYENLAFWSFWPSVLLLLFFLSLWFVKYKKES